MSAQRTYKIRRFENGQNKNGEPFKNYSITIPGAIAERLPEDMLFTVEVTDDGILLKPYTGEEEAVEMPAWAKTTPTNGKPTKRQRPEPAAAE